MRRILASFFVANTLLACAPGKPAVSIMAASAVKNLGCSSAQSEMWNSFLNVVEQGQSFPTASDLRHELTSAGQNRGLNPEALKAYTEAFVTTYSTIISGIQTKLDPHDEASWKKALAELELGARTTSVHAELQDRLEAALLSLDQSEAGLKVGCSEQAESAPAPNKSSYGTVWEQLKATATPEIYGARKTLAIAYQSCEVLKLDPMTSATPDVEGILDIGVRTDGGHIRKISSVASVDATDYYIHNQNLAASSCFEVRNDPLIYNFGGKPTTYTGHPYLLDLFTHNHGGGPSLGIDCSAYVFSALALAGLKMDPNPKKVLKASLVWGIGSSMFKEPQSNGLRCLKKISVNAKTSILAGDIVAINGHVIMIDSVGADPLALSAIKSLDQCTPENIQPSQFDFVIAQSAPIKNGIGINRVRAADYMPESDTIRDGLVAYAVAACRARFGARPNLSSPDLSIVRHTKTAACRAPKPLTMAHENCVQSCHPL